MLTRGRGEHGDKLANEGAGRPELPAAVQEDRDLSGDSAVSS